MAVRDARARGQVPVPDVGTGGRAVPARHRAEHRHPGEDGEHHGDGRRRDQRRTAGPPRGGQRERRPGEQEDGTGERGEHGGGERGDRAGDEGRAEEPGHRRRQARDQGDHENDSATEAAQKSNRSHEGHARNA
ncbi:hypothetical protein [Microtetraspora fusca]|uniref:hypothetical protein n=1 Tax=Microtetraspora fusca TaxID=1997 RepID=UPI001FE2015D|nr:hypothetical protein [Microtetraspora fusca]